jgi:ATP-binding cassette subfamily B multidrug efflux pump
VVKRLFAYIGQYKKYVISCIFLMTFDVLCEMMMPFLMAKIVDVGIPQKDIAFIARVGGLMIVLALAAIGFGVLNMRFSANASQGFAANIRRALFDKVQSFSFSNIDYFSTASLVTRLTNDVTQMQVMLLMSLRILLRAPLMLITACFFAMSINLKLSGIILIAMPVLVISIYFVIRSAEHLFSTMQQRLDSLNNTVRENLIAIRVVKAFVREEYEKLKFKKVNDAFTKAAINAGYLISLAMPVILFILNFTTIAVIWFGGKMVSTGTMGTGELIGFISYVMQILTSTMIFSMVFILYARAEASAQRIVEVLDAKVDIADKPALPEGGITPSVSSGKVEFKNVYFRYGNNNGNGSIKEGKDVLSDITLDIEAREIVGIIGGTGSGKSSLISLIPRLYDVTAGQVLVDGTDVRDYNLKTLRDGIGIVLQTNVLFSGTIRENLLWGNENATQEEIEEAARNAQAHDFIMSFPDGYDTILGQAGVNLSGGQKQRLCIARALLKKPYILILDDSTSSVDVATEAKIMESFNKNLKESTIIIISQRISSIKEADKIIVLDDGKISGIGTHEMLYESNTIYREIYDTQQGGLIL